MIEQAILIGMAAYRLASLLTLESGPFDIFEKLRNFVGLKEGKVEGFLPLLFSCIWCMSVWMVFLVYILWLIEPVGVMLIAAAAVAVIVHSFVGSNG